MATYDELIAAARKADADGAGDDARRLLEMAVALRDDAKAPTQSARDQYGEMGFTQVFGKAGDGLILQNPASGAQAYVSPGYNTSNPDEVAKLAKGATPAETFWNEPIVQANPVKARALKVVEGTPFIGSYADDAVGAVFGGDARDAWRATSRAMDDTRPWQSAGLQLTGGIASAAPVMMAGGGMNLAANSLGGNMLRGGAFGLAEGAVRGFGAGEGGAANRRGNAVNDAWKGAAVGAAVPALAHGAGAAYGGIKNWLAQNRGIDRVSSSLGISKDAGRLASNVIGMDDPQAMQAAMRAAGPNAMVADAGPSVQGALDAVIQSPGEGAQALRFDNKLFCIRLDHKIWLVSVAVYIENLELVWPSFRPKSHGGVDQPHLSGPF